MPSSKKKSALVKETTRKSKSASGKVEKKKKSTGEPAREKKKKKKQERMDTELASDDEDEAEVLGTDDEQKEDANEEAEVVSEDEDNVKDKKARAKKLDTRTEAEKEKARKLKVARRNQKSKRRGFRTIAKRAGYSSSAKRAGQDGSVDVAIPITSVSEAIRACKWAPKQWEKPAFEGLTEFDERTQLAHASLPKKAARVFHAHGEQFLRRLCTQTMQNATDQLKTRATAAIVASVTRPLRRALKFSFVAPKGVVRFSQKSAKGIRLRYADGEQSLLEEEKALHKLQARLGAKIELKALEEKKPKPNLDTLKTTNEEINKIRKAAKDAGFA